MHPGRPAALGLYPLASPAATGAHQETACLKPGWVAGAHLETSSKVSCFSLQPERCQRC